MKSFKLDGTNIVTIQNAFGALPVQRRTMADAVKILRRAYDGGMTFFDTARAYSDSEEKIGEAFKDIPRDRYFLATKTGAKTPEEFWNDLHTSLKNLRTDYVDIYQFHCAPRLICPDDGSGLYECMLEAKKQGKIRYISATAHKIGVGEEIAKSGLYSTLQFPFSYLADEKDIALVNLCKEKGVGFIAMKGLSGGLITDSRVAMAFMLRYSNVLPIWGVQKESELEEWLSFIDNPPQDDSFIDEVIRKDKEELSGSFCRGCGYCMPCPQGITINQLARISLMLRRAPTKNWLTKDWQDEMKKVELCLNCKKCMSKCPYSLDIPSLLKANYKDFFEVLNGEKKA